MRETKYWGVRTASLIALGVAAGIVATPAPASATVIDFESDGLTCQEQFAPSTLVIDGFTFNGGWSAECDASYIGGWGNPSGAPSAETAAAPNYIGYDTDGLVPTITRATPFNFVGANVSSFLSAGGWLEGLSSLSLLIEGCLLGNCTQQILINFDDPYWAAPGYIPVVGSLLNVDEVRFYSAYAQGASNTPDSWLIDDVNLTDVAAVPEPATLTLFGTGLSAYAMFRRSRRRHAGRTSAES